jgi:hypothetical protein
LKYENVPRFSRGEIEALLKSARSEDVQIGLLSTALYEPDAKWAEHQCLLHLDDADSHVRSAAVTGLAHVARIHAALDLERVLPKLAELAHDPAIAGIVSDAMEDIWIFMGRKREHK